MTKSDASSPLVSIITPTYNHEKFIRSCIESVLGQTYQNWEQIIIDDGSTDNTGGIVSAYHDPRIHYERQLNRGPFELATTYNRALSLAKGELVAILEGDDFWPPAKLATLVPAFADDTIVLAYGEAVDVDPIGHPQRRASRATRLRQKLPRAVLFNDPMQSATRYMLLMEGRSLVSPSTVILRRCALESIGGFQYVPGLPLTDYPTFMKFSLIGQFHYCSQVMGYRRRHASSITVKHARTIHQQVSGFTLEFLAKHQDTFSLRTPEIQIMKENWEASVDNLHFSEARHLLLQRSWVAAREQFRLASQSKNTVIRLAAFIGLLFAYLHKDIEPLMGLGGRATLGQVHFE